MLPLKTDRQIFRMRSRSFNDICFPLKLRPQNDELLSSWLIRLSLLHRTMPMTFTNLYLPETKNRFWVADIDLQADPVMLSLLSAKSGLPIELLHSLTLKSYEGYLVENVYGKTRATKFVSALGLRGRRSTLPGLRYCPLCLVEDERPYYRKKWRLSFSVVCTRHQCYLSDRCPKCGTTITPYLACKTGRADVCYKCGQVLTSAPVSVPENGEIVSVVESLYRIMGDGYVVIADSPVYSHLYFAVLHQILRLMLSRKYGSRVREGAGIDSLGASGCKTFESVPIRDQAQMLIKAVWLLSEWPQRFIDVCEQQSLFSSALLQDLEQAPLWYRKVVIDVLYHPDSIVTDEEIREAAKLMLTQGLAISEHSLSKILGVRQVFRKRIKKLVNLQH